MDIADIRKFIQLLSDGSISQAASNLYMSQQGLSRAIKRLEDELGVPLFERSHSGVVPTRYGELFRPSAERILSEYDSAANEIHSERTAKAPSVYIAMETGSLSMLGEELFSEYSKLYPEDSIVLQEHSASTCDRLLIEEEADVSFATFPKRTEFQQDYFPCVPIWGVVLVNRHNPLSECKEITLEELSNEKLIFFGCSTKLCYSRAFNRASLPFSIAYSSIESRVSLDLVNTGRGVCPSFYGKIDEQALSGTDIVMRPFISDVPWAICMVTKKHRALPKAAQNFVRFIKGRNWPDIDLSIAQY